MRESRKTLGQRGQSARNSGASENHNPRCTFCGKACFRSEHHARLATRTIGNRVRVYYCHDGGAWHITKSFDYK